MTEYFGGKSFDFDELKFVVEYAIDVTVKISIPVFLRRRETLHF
jgi:hypothetical protein